MKISLFLGLLLPLINAGSSSSSSYTYNVKVVYAKELPDEDPDGPWGLWENVNDPYVQIYGYGTGGDDKIKIEETSVKEGTEEPEWNEEFKFEDDDANGPYLKFLFKIYDDDCTFGSDIFNDPDFLGETEYILTSEIKDCTDIFSESLKVSRDGKEGGELFVEITKDGCDGDESSEESKEEGGGYGDDDDEEEEQPSGKGSGGSGKTKRLLR